MVFALLTTLFFFSSAEVVTVQLESNFTLSWEFGENQDISFTFACAFDGWCGIGFNEGMTKTDMILLLHLNQMTPVAWDAWSATYEPPKADSTIDGCENNLSSFNLGFANGVLTGSVSRLLDTGDANCDKVLQAGQTIDFCYAYLTQAGLTGIERHNNAGTGKLTLGTTQANSKWVPKGQDDAAGFLVISFFQAFLVILFN